jgi:hypothetical protein
MTVKYAKVHEIAERFRVSVDAVYLWIRQGKIPADCVVRIAGTVRVDEAQFEQRLHSGALYQPRGRKVTALPGPDSGNALSSTISEDSFTTVGQAPSSEHRWTGETGRVKSDHPFSPEMISTST